MSAFRASVTPQLLVKSLGFRALLFRGKMAPSLVRVLGTKNGVPLPTVALFNYIPICTWTDVWDFLLQQYKGLYCQNGQAVIPTSVPKPPYLLPAWFSFLFPSSFSQKCSRRSRGRGCGGGRRRWGGGRRIRCQIENAKIWRSVNPGSVDSMVNTNSMLFVYPKM